MFYKKLLFSVMLFNMMVVSMIQSASPMGGLVADIKQGWQAPTLTSIDDYRIGVLVGVGVVSMALGAVMTYQYLFEQSPTNWKNSFKGILTFITGNSLMASGLATIIGARAIISLIDKGAHKQICEINHWAQ